MTDEQIVAAYIADSAETMNECGFQLLYSQAKVADDALVRLVARAETAEADAENANAHALIYQRRADRLAAALEFYADPANHALTLQDVARGRNPRVVDDGGHRAREALAGEDA